MNKLRFSLLLSVLCISMLSYALDGWIRINSLGYLPYAPKSAILISETPTDIKEFSIYDALTNKKIQSFSSISQRKETEPFSHCFKLDFSSFTCEGAFYIKAGLIYSPTIFINKSIYLSSADNLLDYFREQRSRTTGNGTYPIAGIEPTRTIAKYNNTTTTKNNTKVIRKTQDEEVVVRNTVDLPGGWHDSEESYTQYGSITANIVYQLCFAYQNAPLSFTDKYNANGKKTSNKIPDILDEAKWGLDWLLKSFPDPGHLYYQISNKYNSDSILTPMASVFPETSNNKQHYGIASVAGKYSSAFSIGAEVFSKFNKAFADTLRTKAIEAYNFGKQFPGACLYSANGKIKKEETNWTDDMELAAILIYRQNFDNKYLNEAAAYGRTEPVTPWMCSDTARHYQWFPYFNHGHFLLACTENPRYQREFILNIQSGLQRIKTNAQYNSFGYGVPFIRNSNCLVSSLIMQCKLYNNLTNDTTYNSTITDMTDWLFGKNPWGKTMVNYNPKGTKRTLALRDKYNLTLKYNYALINGPVNKKTFNTFGDIKLPAYDPFERFQSENAVYHDCNTDYETNMPTLDGSALLSAILSGLQQQAEPGKTEDLNTYEYGGLVRGNPQRKQVVLIFSGNKFADGYKQIAKILKAEKVKASFFFSGSFYRKYKSIVKNLKKGNYYLGASSDNSPIYTSWSNRDSVAISKDDFQNDLRSNFEAMEKLGISKQSAPFFLPPYENYNDSISRWSYESGLKLICSTPGTLSSFDNTIPDMREQYYSSNEIYNKIIQTEQKSGLNGYILHFHIGTDIRRTDKFYQKIGGLINELKKRGYDFADLYEISDIYSPSAARRTK